MMNEKVQKLLDARKAIEIQKKDIEAQLKDIDKELNKIEADYRPSPRYGNREVSLADENEFRFYKIPNATEFVRITEYLVNENEKDEHIEAFGSIMGSWDQSRRSVAYFRINGILLHAGGGYILMNEYLECSDEEWEQIKQGNIPDRLANKGL